MTLPFFISGEGGMPWMRNWAAICCCSSVFTLMKTASPAAWAAALANSGGHHLAGAAPRGPEVDDDGQRALRDERGKGGGAVISTGAVTRGRSALQVPQRPCWLTLA